MHNCCSCSQEAKQFTNKYNAATLSVPKDCKCLFFYGEDDTDEYKKQGKDFMKVNNIMYVHLYNYTAMKPFRFLLIKE